MHIPIRPPSKRTQLVYSKKANEGPILFVSLGGQPLPANQYMYNKLFV